jgi:ATP-dependent Clp protease protease subunit
MEVCVMTRFPSARQTPRGPSAHGVLPEFTERTGTGRRTMNPYDRLLQDRIVLLGTPLDDTAANDVVAQLIHLEHLHPDREVSLYINSPGGPFSAMTAIRDTMAYLSCDVVTLCLGQAVSTAAVLLAAGTPGKRAALPGARVVLRQPVAETPLQGRADDLAIQAGELVRVRDRMQEMLVEHTGRTPEQVRADLDRETVLDARGALAHGLVDRILPARRDTRTAPDAG